MTTSTLGFTIRPVANASDLRRACQVRAASYGHHMPAWGQQLLEPDALDRGPDTLVLLCEDKRSGQAIGSLRIQTSRSGPLLIERSVRLPEAITRQGRAEVTRLSAVPGADPLVKLALCKAAYLHCGATQSRHVVIGARNEALIRQYRRAGFRDLGPDYGSVPLAHAGNLPHRVLVIDIAAAAAEWARENRALFDFIFGTTHRDIDVSERPRLPLHLAAMAA